MIINKLNDFNGSELITFDPYVPLDIKWGDWDEMQESSIYFRFGDLKKSLLEIGIGFDTGVLRSLTLVSTDVVDMVVEDSNIKSRAANRKIPIFSIVKENTRSLFNESNYLRVNISYDEIGIFLQEDVVNNVFATGRVCFGVNCSNEIVAIWVTKIVSSDIETFKNATSPSN